MYGSRFRGNPSEPLNASAPLQPALRVLAETAAVPPAAQQEFICLPQPQKTVACL